MISRNYCLSVALLALISTTASARAGTVTAFLYEASNNDPAADAVGVDLNIVDTTGGVQVTATITDIASLSLGSGDILALWFDVSPAANLALVNYSDPYDPANLNVTGFVKGPGPNTHDTIGSAPFGGDGPNIDGLAAPFSASTKYDMAIRLGTSGMSPDFYPSASFKLTNLTAADFGSVGNRFAARVTSIGSSSSGASGKYAGYGDFDPDTVTVVPTPTAAMGGLALLGLLCVCGKRIF